MFGKETNNQNRLVLTTLPVFKSALGSCILKCLQGFSKKHCRGLTAQSYADVFRSKSHTQHSVGFLPGKYV